MSNSHVTQMSLKKKFDDVRPSPGFVRDDSAEMFYPGFKKSAGHLGAGEQNENP